VIEMKKKWKVLCGIPLFFVLWNLLGLIAIFTWVSFWFALFLTVLIIGVWVVH